MISPNKKPPEIETKTLRLADFSMGLNTTISGSLLNNNELQVAEDVSFEQKGTIMPRRGRRKRYEEAFSDSPCCGLGSYYKKDGTTKLLFAAGDKLYSDSPSISIKWDNQNDWEETNSKQVNLDSSTTPGDIQIKESTQTVPTFTRDSVAYLSDGTEVASGQPRFEDGKFGKGVLIEEGTTNLLSANQSSVETDLTGFTYDGADVVLTRDTSVKLFDNASLKTVTPANAGYGPRTVVNTVPGFPERTYTASIYLKGLNGNEKLFMELQAYTASGTILNWATSWVVLSTEWQRFTVTLTTAENTAYLSLKWGNNGALAQTFWTDGLQIEEKPYATSWQLGGTARTAEVLTIPTAGVLSPQEGTWGQWVYVDSTARRQVANQWPTIFRIPGVSSVGIWLCHDNDMALWRLYAYNDGGVDTTAECPDSYTPDGWHHFVVAWKSGEIALFIDGVRRATITNPNMPSGFAANAYIGFYGLADFLNTVFDELRIDNIARTDAEIADWYNANEPSTPDEYTTYLSHFDGSLSSVSGKLPYAYWESAPKDVSQASNKASGKAVITQTLNSGQVALYSASSPTSSGTYSDWALALPDGTLQHPPDNFVKIKLKLIDTDPYTVLLMHMDGSDNGTTFTDECGKTVTAQSNVVTKTAEKRFGTASAYFDGTGNYLSVPASEDFNFGAGDFTIDFWFYYSNPNLVGMFFGQSNTDGYTPVTLHLNNQKLQLALSTTGTEWTVNIVDTDIVPLDTWHHVALVRNGNVFTVYLNGVPEITTTQSITLYDSSEPMLIGRYFEGYIDEFRISKGVARWTSDFIPPTSQYVLNSRPVVHGLTMTFDGEPSATPILDDMSFGAEYMFTTLKDILVIANGQNAPYKWDGIGTPTLLGGNPPVLDFITTHNNRVWGVDAADKSRVRFSDILDPETWSVLNFIDFNPDDGDYITAMVRIGQDLLVSKQWSMALLTGNATTNYSVVWLDVEQGVTGKRALCNTNKYFTYVAQDGIRFTDFNTHAVASERLLPDWEKINKRRLNQAAMVYWRNYLLVSLPRDNSLYNNTVWAYDMLRNAWSIINGWNVSNWLIFKQYGEEVLLAADSTTGQIYEVMRYSRYDDTEPVTYNVRTKDFTFNAPERYKLFRNINLDLEATAVESPLTVDLIVDGEKVGEYNTIVPADDRAKVHRMILPPLYNAVIGRSLSLALRGRCGIQGISLTYSFGGIVPDEEV